MYSPFKMKGKSPMMKALVGKQNNLPDQLKAKILAAPESPAKMMKKSPAKMKKESPAMMKKESSMKMMKKSPAKKKFNPFSAESKRMTASQKRKAQDADPTFKGNKQKVGKELKAAKSKTGGSVRNILDKLDAGLQKVFNNPRKTSSSKTTNKNTTSKKTIGKETTRSKFNKAFAEASKANKATFDFEGKSYTTKKK